MNGVITTPLQFGIGDGVTTQFQLEPTPGTLISSVVTATLHRTDWQGRQLLYATPRTNLLPGADAMGGSGWVNTATGTFTTGQPGADGRPTALYAVASTVTTYSRIQFSDTAATIYTVSFFVKQGAATAAPRLGILDGTGTTTIAFLRFVWVSGVPTVSASSGIVGTPTITSSDGVWFRVSFSFNTGTYTTARTYFYPDNVNGTGGTYFNYPQVEIGPVATSYIPTTTTAVTVTDYAVSNSGVVTLGQAAAKGAVLDWTGAYIYTPTDAPSNFPLNTILSQYANSARIVQIIENLSDCIDPSADIDAFFDNVWNIDTAVGYGLDVWGRIVGLPNGRILKIPSSEINFGFSQAGTASAAPFGSGVFYNGVQETQNFALSDDAFRTLILVKAMANILDGSIPSYNKLLQLLFAGRGRCYVNDLGNMQMRYTFEFYLEPFEMTILTSSGILPRPTGVLASIIQVPVPNIFGFSEAGTASVAPFGQGALFSGGTTSAS